MKFAFALVGLMVATLATASAQDLDTPAETRLGNQFFCEDGSSLAMRFGSQGQAPIAAVWAGKDRHVLPLQPWDGVTPQIVWSDGPHKLTWNPGVQITWADGASQLSCGRRGGRRHE